MRSNTNNKSWYENVDWDLPDAEIARRVFKTRERIRQLRRDFHKPKSKLFGSHYKSIERSNRLISHWVNGESSIKEAAQIMGVSYSNACGILKRMKLNPVDQRKQ